MYYTFWTIEVHSLHSIYLGLQRSILYIAYILDYRGPFFTQCISLNLEVHSMHSIHLGLQRSILHIVYILDFRGQFDLYIVQILKGPCYIILQYISWTLEIHSIHSIDLERSILNYTQYPLGLQRSILYYTQYTSSSPNCSPTTTPFKIKRS